MIDLTGGYTMIQDPTDLQLATSMSILQNSGYIEDYLDKGWSGLSQDEISNYLSQGGVLFPEQAYTFNIGGFESYLAAPGSSSWENPNNWKPDPLEDQLETPLQTPLPTDPMGPGIMLRAITDDTYYSPFNPDGTLGAPITGPDNYLTRFDDTTGYVDPVTGQTYNDLTGEPITDPTNIDSFTDLFNLGSGGTTLFNFDFTNLFDNFNLNFDFTFDFDMDFDFDLGMGSLGGMLLEGTLGIFNPQAGEATRGALKGLGAVLTLDFENMPGIRHLFNLF